MTLTGSSDKSLSLDPQICPYCHDDFNQLSPEGFENHVEYCRIVVGVPDVKSQRSQIHG